MPTPEEIKANMDKAAEEAAKELKKLDKAAVKVVAAWMKTHFTQAGYKRLSRLLLVATVSEPKAAKKTED
jgi:ribonuclease HI